MGAPCRGAFSDGEMRRQQPTGSVQRRARFVDDRVIGLEDVRHPRGYVERDLDVGRDGLLREGQGVVEEHLVVPACDQGRQARQVGEHGADEAESGVSSRRVVPDSGLEGFPAEQRVDLAPVSIVAPARLRSAYGDMTRAAAAGAARGRGR